MSTPQVPEGQTPIGDTAELLAAVKALTARVESLEGELAIMRANTPVPEDVVVAISAAVAAYLGHRAKVTRVHYRTGRAWAQQGRVAVQGTHHIQRAR